MDNEKDLLIKKMLEKDQLISKKADDVFQDFFERGIKMEEEKVVKMDEHKNKNIRKKKILAAVASLMVVFVAANVYAGTMGYNNIFFMIKNMFEKTEVTNKDDILTDRDLTISYQSIETSDGLKIQVNRLVVKDNEAVLYMNIDKSNTSVNPARCIVHDITDGRNDLIGNESISNSKNEDRYEAQSSLIGMRNNTNILNIQLQDDNYNNIVELELDIANKTISIVGGTAKELEKISEVELKEVLGNYIRIFMFEDLGSVVKEVHTEQEYRNECIVDIALDYLTKAKNVYSADKSRVNSIISEVTGEEITDVLPLSNLIIEYDKKTDSYNYFVKTKGRKALCLEVTDLKYSDGIYTATFTYCYPTEEDYKKGNVENLQLFSATMKLKINSDYEYAKYCMVDYKNIEREKIDNNSQSIVNTNENTVTNTVNNNTVTNTLNNNTVTNTVNNTTVTNTVTNNTSANTTNNSSNINNNIKNLKEKIYSEIYDYLDMENTRILNSNQFVSTRYEEKRKGEVSSSISKEGTKIFYTILKRIEDDIVDVEEMTFNELALYEVNNQQFSGSPKTIQFSFEDESNGKIFSDMYVRWNINNQNNITISWWKPGEINNRKSVKFILNKSAESVLNELKQEFALKTNKVIKEKEEIVKETLEKDGAKIFKDREYIINNVTIVDNEEGYKMSNTSANDYEKHTQIFARMNYSVKLKADDCEIGLKNGEWNKGCVGWVVIELNNGEYYIVKGETGIVKKQ